jgi:hypothetical protein
MPILGVIASSAKGAPGIPTIGTATDVGTSRAFNNGAATVTFTPGAGATATSFTATSSPGGFTATGASSPLTVTGLQSSVSYTFTVTATNASGTSAASAASNSITATTVPQAPTIGTAADGGTGTSATVTYTANATGGKAVSAYTATSSPGSLTGTGTSPITVNGLTTGTAYTFTVTATNANGTSLASAASNSVTPVTPTSYESIATFTSGSQTVTFSNIPQTYKHLQLRFNLFSGQSYAARIQFNGETASYYYGASMQGTYESGTSYVRPGYDGASGTMNLFNSIGLDSTYPTTGVFDIIDYTNSSKKPAISGLSGYQSANTRYNWVSLSTGLFNFGSGAAVTSIRVFLDGNTFTTGSSIALYGIK